MTSLHVANVWDWLSTAFTIVGFTTLLGLAAYLMILLVSSGCGEAPEDNRDRLVLDGPVDEMFGDRFGLRAS